jgi:solute carrier family 25 (adenine nucleotide translocator) protein 4/5/6/31
VKLLLQNQSALIKSGRLDSRYKGVFDCFNRIYINEGLLSFWRGNSANIIREMPTQALNFALKDYYKSLFHYDPKESYWKWFAGNIASGSAAGSTTLIVVYPLDFARTRLANDAKSIGKEVGLDNSRQFTGMLDVFRKTIASDGIAGIYRGFIPSIAGTVVYRGLQFGLYDSLKPTVLSGPLEGNFLASFALGWGVVATAGLCAYPLDTVRRRMMMTSGTGLYYKNFFVAMATIARQEGVSSLMRGALANVMRGVASAGILSIYDQAQAHLIHD